MITEKVQRKLCPGECVKMTHCKYDNYSEYIITFILISNRQVEESSKFFLDKPFLKEPFQIFSQDFSDISRTDFQENLLAIKFGVIE